MKKIREVLAAAFIMSLACAGAWAAEGTDAVRVLVVFHSMSCHHCIKVKTEIMPDIEKRFKDTVKIEYRDIADIENYKLLLGLEKRQGLASKLALPIFYFEGNLFADDGSLRKRLIQMLSAPLGAGARQDVTAPTADVLEHFKQFKPAAIVGAGLVDGINPCAFTVVVFFMSFLALQGYKKRELAAIGSTFIAAVFLTYLSLGVGVFSFLYGLRNFWLVTRIFNGTVGIITVILGCLAVRDLVIFKKTGQTEDMALQLPKSVKNRIHSVIGLHYRKTGSRPIARLLVSAFVTGFLVSLLEAVCTGQVYIPTISFVLKTSPLKAQALWYLVLYNAMFCLPLIVIFILALFGATSAQFAGFLKKNMVTVKVLMAIVFFTLGAFLLWKG